MLPPPDASVQAPPAGPAAPPSEEGEAGGLRRLLGVSAGLLAFVTLLAIPTLPGFTPEGQRTAAVALLMAIWWMSEAIPLAATSLVPLVLFPVLGVLRAADAAAPYANPIIFLFLGGFILALAMERWGLHRRIALAVVARVGTGPRRLVLGFMLATAFLSMWISNTATAAMMLPIGLALAELLRPREPGARFPFGTALMLGIAYGASIGGLGTLIGSPPNAIFAAAARELTGRPVDFFDYMRIGVPLMLVFLPLTWALLVFVLYRPDPLPPGADALLRDARAAQGPMDRGERWTLAVFSLTVLAWLLREPKQLGDVALPGLTQLVPMLDDATIAVGGALLLFLLPVDARAGVQTMDWTTARKLPWGVLLLFGGGLSLARAFEEAGLSRTIAGFLGGLQGMPDWVLLTAAAALFIYLTELTSNTAVAAIAMPVLHALGTAVGANPLVFMMAGAVGASCAFMLPVATPPNALVFGTGYVRMGEMVRAGFWLNLLGVALVPLACYFLVSRVFG